MQYTVVNIFIEYGSTVLYQKWVLEPAFNGNVASHEILFNISCFNGCVGYTDATHAGMLSCAAWDRILHKGFKLNSPSQNYIMTVNHACHILGSTLGHPATWNDKILIMHDKLVLSVLNGNITEDFEFILYERDKDGKIAEAAYKGV